MKKSIYVRFSLSALLMISLLSPMSILAMGDGKKYFKEGSKAEVAEKWDIAVEQYAMAVAEDPKNPEYRLHYTRALFNASQMFMKKGTAQANDKDYAGAYVSFRRAYGYDPVNELAKAEMARMVRLQQAVLDGGNPDEKNNKNAPDTDVKLVKTGYQTASPDTQVPQRLEKLRDVPFPSGVDLQFLIKELAKDLDLNVLFDSETFRQGTNQKIFIELKNVTAAKALDYVFLQQGLFFQKVGPRTILVANGNRRQNFQQLVLRTFYLANADPKDVQKVLQSAIPAQPGRTPTISIVDDDTNSITIRDTEENIRLMAKLISSLDKDRAEVVMDVAIYEVSKSDLLKLGNQIGTNAQLNNLGGTVQGSVGLAASEIFKNAFGVGITVPSMNLSAFQSKQNTKLIASTQIHAFNNEDSSARIGQRVPVRTATISNGTNNNNGGVGSPGFLSDVINYEQVGLTLKFKPIVFPNQDVQVAMEIESKDVVACNTSTDNPCFSERTIKGTARVQNNKTLLLASVAQDSQTNSRQGLPLLGLIPILGRLFTAPSKNNSQVDIVIAVTPKVIRAPIILPEDEVERPTGSLAVPTSGSLEAMIIQEEREELLAAARRLPTTTAVQLPDQKATDAPTYVKSNAPQSVSQNTETPTETNAATQTPALPLSSLKPIDSSVKTLDIGQTSENIANSAIRNLQETSYKSPETAVEENKAAETPETANTTAPLAEIQLLSALPEMKVGDKTKIAVMVKSVTAFRSAVLGLRFDHTKLAVRSVSFGDAFGTDLANTLSTPFLNQGGKMNVSLSSPKDSAQNTSGVLAFIEVEALAAGTHEIKFDRDVMNILTADGRNFTVKF
jgi:general secretion pathway protein D